MDRLRESQETLRRAREELRRIAEAKREESGDSDRVKRAVADLYRSTRVPLDKLLKRATI